MYRGRLINSSPVKISWTNARTCGNVSDGPCARPPAFGLEKREGHGADDHVVLPAGIRAAFEMIEPEFGLEVLIVLFDRPALMRQPHELRQRGRRRQRDEVVLAAAGRPEAPFAEQPDFGGEPPLPPVGGRRHAQGREVGGPTAHWSRCATSTRCHARGRQRVAERADADGVLSRASRRGDCAAAVACDRRAAWACRGTPSASARCPAHTAAAADAASGGPCGCRRIRHRRRPRSASGRRRACGAPASARVATSLERRPSPESAPWPAAPDRSSTSRADRATRPSATRAGPSTAPPSPRLGNSPPCPSAPQYCRAAPTECGPDFGKARFVEDQNARALGQSRPATGATRTVGIPRARA